jgi:hypothetical protein
MSVVLMLSMHWQCIAYNTDPVPRQCNGMQDAEPALLM